MIEGRQKNPFKAEHGGLIYILSIFALLCLQLICSVALTAIKKHSTAAYQTGVMAAGIALQAGNALIFFLLIKKFNAVPDIFIPKKPLSRGSGVWVAAGAGCGLLCLVFFYPVNTVWMLLLDKMGYNPEGAIFLDNAPQIALLVISACVLAPIFEELIYRSALLSGLDKTFKNKYAAIILCGAAFSLMHMNPAQTVYQFFLGATCAILALNSRSVLPGIAAHLISNLTVILAELTPLGKAFLHYEEFLCSGLAVKIIMPVIMTAAGAAAVFFGSQLLKSKLTVDAAEKAAAVEGGEAQAKKENQQNSLSLKKLLILGLGVSAAVWLLMLLAG